MSQILITGGAGYIGSHTCIEFLNAGYKIVVFDNFSNSYPESLIRVQKITGKSLIAIKGDIRDQSALEGTLQQYSCSAVIHLAGLKSVRESVEKPLKYYDNNVIGTHCLLKAMKSKGVSTIVFSSSATVYGDPLSLPLAECHPLSPKNPYGRSKLMIEEMLRDHFVAAPHWRICILRYFNPAGAHESGLIGEDPQGIPDNLMPYVAQVAVGRREKVNVWGSDYSTPDGTGVRDYIHVGDLAVGHLKALERLCSPQCFAVNLGTSRGYSVLEVIQAFETVSGKCVPFFLAPRRAGDVAAYYADATRAEKLLGWRALRGIETMCADSWRWQQKNPNGYNDATK